MTKKEKELYTHGLGIVRSARHELMSEMKSYDESWPRPILQRLDEAIRYFVQMRPK